jgi:hypothetical protein
MVDFIHDDGGREAAGFKGSAGDCVCRAIAIAAGLDYRAVYTALHGELTAYADAHRDRTARRIARRGGRSGTTPCNGVSKKVYGPYLAALGFQWMPTMQIGQGCTVHLRADELPRGRLVVRVSRHVTAVIDGVIHDTHDCSRGGTRCVYGYWQQREEWR